MRKVVCLFFICLLVTAVFTGCGSDAPASSMQTESAAESVTAPVTEPTAAPTEPFMPPVVLMEEPTEAPREPASTKTSTELAPDGKTVALSIDWVYDKDNVLIESRSVTYLEDGREAWQIHTACDSHGNRLTERASGIVIAVDEQGLETVTDQTFVRLTYCGPGHLPLQETYSTYGPDGALLHSSLTQCEFRADSSLAKERWVLYHPNGNIREDILRVYAPDGTVADYRSQYFYDTGSLQQQCKELRGKDGVLTEEFRAFYYENGQLSRLVQKEYQQGVLTKNRELHGYENGIRSFEFSGQYNASGDVLEEYRIQRKEDGSTILLRHCKFSSDGEEIFYHHEQYYDDGSLQHKHLKNYDEAGQLRKQEYLSYYEDLSPASIRLSEYNADGTLLKEDSTEYAPDGTVTYRSKFPDEASGGFIPRKQTVYYENGNLQFVDDGLYSPDGTTLMSGKREVYHENGQLHRLEEATYDQQTRTRTLTETNYDESGKETYSYLRKETYDETGNVCMRDETAYGNKHASRSHTLDFFTYDETGNKLTADTTFYDKNGTVTEKRYQEWDYDEAGRQIRNSTSFRTADGQQTERQEILHIYGSNGNLLREELATFDAADVEDSRTIDEYNDQGLLIVRTNRRTDFVQVVTYTYDGGGRVITEFSVRTPVEAEAAQAEESAEPEEPVIQYRKITNEYYENGQLKTYCSQSWTSEDEKEAKPGTAQEDLGKIFVENYDENGNRT